MVRQLQTTVIENNGNPLQVQGALTFATVPALATAARRWVESGKDTIIIDLAGVSHSDSAGLALLLQWVGDVQAAGSELKFVNIPSQVEDFIRINGLAQLLID